MFIPQVLEQVISIARFTLYLLKTSSTLGLSIINCMSKLVTWKAKVVPYDT